MSGHGCRLDRPPVLIKFFIWLGVPLLLYSPTPTSSSLTGWSLARVMRLSYAVFLLTALCANAYELEAPIEGYGVVVPEWEVEVTPGGPTTVLNGTIEEVHDELRQLNPNWDEDSSLGPILATLRIGAVADGQSVEPPSLVKASTISAASRGSRETDPDPAIAVELAVLSTLPFGGAMIALSQRRWAALGALQMVLRLLSRSVTSPIEDHLCQESGT
ncbi:hypothetical protein BHE90_017500 [Fusarium euwallaceae]|uniref:Uncharacterized protein n=3 Tax=Fusarium solani species complex TaxID=232080 RepID=A0A428RRI9_9HYPO|nr:hypothetical protein CEP51_016348 [Fusarium floridanum]RSL80164.1 hypothetical protein CEP52_017429 [Fusarium oligoseptatum]RTE68123.1 hypothetical protein BHE90_017500 [Fusarium euwallaceae]